MYSFCLSSFVVYLLFLSLLFHLPQTYQHLENAMQAHRREVQAALDADEKSRRERQQAKHARKQLKRFRAVILTAKKDRQAGPLEKALASFKTNCSDLEGAPPLIALAETLLQEFAEERAQMADRKKATTALKKAIKTAKASRDPEPLQRAVQNATNKHVPAGHPLVAKAERLLRDISDEKRHAAAIAALQEAIEEAKRTRATTPIKSALKAALEQHVNRDHPVVEEARKLLQLLQEEEDSRLHAEAQLLKSIGVAKRVLALENPSFQSIEQAKKKLISAKIKALKVCGQINEKIQ